MSTTTSTASIPRPNYQTGRPRFDSVLASQLGPLSARARARPSSPTAAKEPAVDMDRLLGTVGDDPDELRLVVNMYLAESQRVMGELSASVQAGDWDETHRLAHRLAGTSATCGMAAMVPPLRELEITAKAGRWSRNQTLLLEARHQQARVCACLEGYGLKKSAVAPEVGEARQ